MSDSRETLIASTFQAAPATTAIVLWIGGKDINFWLAVAGLIFICLQVGHLIWKWSWHREMRRLRMAPPTGSDHE